METAADVDLSAAELDGVRRTEERGWWSAPEEETAPETAPEEDEGWGGFIVVGGFLCVVSRFPSL